MAKLLKFGFVLGTLVSGAGLAEVRRGEGVFLDASYHENGEKICRFSNGTIVRIEIGDDCFASGPPRKSKIVKQSEPPQVLSSAAETKTPVNNLSGKYRRGAGVYLNSSEHGPNGEKYCRFSNGVTIRVKIAEDCFAELPLKSVPVANSQPEPVLANAESKEAPPKSSLVIKMGSGIFLNSSFTTAGEKYCNFSNGLTYEVGLRQDCFGQEPVRVIPTKDLEDARMVASIQKRVVQSRDTSGNSARQKNTSSPACANCKTRKTKRDPSLPN